MDNVQAINNFFYWIFNHKMTPGREVNPNDDRYYPDVVMEADWACDRRHLMSKWQGRDCSSVAERALLFYSELDKTNRRIMLEWICNNYDCGITV